MPDMCHICRRQSRGFGFSPKGTGINVKACSIRCQKTISTVYAEAKILIDPTRDEMNAVIEGGRSGGEYLESIGKFSLNELSKEEFTQFLLCVIGGYIEHLKNEVPF